MARSFFAWCQKNDLLSAGKRSPLAEYQVRNAPVTPKHMPSGAEMVALLKAAREYWNP